MQTGTRIATALALAGLLSPDLAAQAHLYWVEWDTQTIRRSNLNGTGVVNLITDVGFALSPQLDADNGHIYWLQDAYGEEPSIRRADLDGGNIVDVVTDLTGTPRGLAIDHGRGHLFWATYDEIWRSDLSGANATVIVKDENATTFALDATNGAVCWGRASFRDTIWRADLDGANPFQIAETDTRDLYITTEPATGFVYWADMTDHSTLRRVDLDGANQADVAPLTSGGYVFASPTTGGALHWFNGWGQIGRIDTSGGHRVILARATRPGATMVDDRPVIASGLSITPAPSVHVGFPSRFLAIAELAGGGQRDISGAATWSVDNEAVAGVSSIGMVHGAGEGLTTLRATYGGFASESTLAVALSPALLDLHLVSAVAGRAANEESRDASISGDGRTVVFSSIADDLVANDDNGHRDVFVADLDDAAVVRVSVSAAGEEAEERAEDPAISADGRYVAFVSRASNLVEPDTNGHADVFIHDRTTGSLRKLTITPDGAEANGRSETPTFSADGRFIAFVTQAGNLIDPDLGFVREQVVVHDTETGDFTLATVGVEGDVGNSWSGPPSLSADGRFVAFWSTATNLVFSYTGNSADSYVRDLELGTTELVALTPGGFPSSGSSYVDDISADGRYVLFGSGADDLVADDTNGVGDLFLRDRLEGRTERVSLRDDGGQIDMPSGGGCLTADARYVTFRTTAADVVSGIPGGAQRVYRRHRRTGRTELISENFRGEPGDDNEVRVGGADMSDDGATLAFSSLASNLAPFDDNTTPDVFVRRLAIVCIGDVDGNGRIGFEDVLAVLARWGPCQGCAEDLDGDGDVGFADLMLLLTTWGPCD